MKKSVLARSSAGIVGAAAVAGLTIAMAPAASAQLAITNSTAYCAGTTYTITFPAADAAAMASQYGANNFVLEATNTTGNVTWWSAPVTSTSGQDVTFQWTPSSSVPASASAVGSWNLYVTESGVAAAAEGPLSVTVVQTAPSGTTCSPSTLGTGSASQTLGSLLTNLLSSLSASSTGQ
ncbi:hypothetical protein ACIRRA_27930 [Nocardia sp. NPDC101769]|uniref:hypothetical protein n=1 Tax=Nocardia sp. NPDC101769 TaxID=3364333 RepID=UPI0037FC3655